MHLEAEYLGLIPLNGLLRDHVRIDLEEDVLKGCAKVGAVNVGVAGGFGIVEIFAFAAEEFDRLGVGDVGHAGR